MIRAKIANRRSLVRNSGRHQTIQVLPCRTIEPPKVRVMDRDVLHQPGLRHIPVTGKRLCRLRQWRRAQIDTPFAYVWDKRILFNLTS